MGLYDDLVSATFHDGGAGSTEGRGAKEDPMASSSS